MKGDEKEKSRLPGENTAQQHVAMPQASNRSTARAFLAATPRFVAACWKGRWGCKVMRKRKVGYQRGKNRSTRGVSESPWVLGSKRRVIRSKADKKPTGCSLRPPAGLRLSGSDEGDKLPLQFIRGVNVN